MGEVKLLGSYGSPFSRRVEIALKMKGVEYEFIQQDLVNKSPLLLKYNPVHKKVPVLLHNENPIVESLVIMEYIDETFPGISLLPKDSYQRANARFWAKFISDTCMVACWNSIWPTGKEQQEAKVEAQEALKLLEDELKGKRFFGGDSINFVDISANFIALWLGVLEEISGVKLLSEDKYPRLCQWINDYLNCSIIKENMPERDILKNYFQTRFQAATASN